MECKVYDSSCLDGDEPSINRNILECKVGCAVACPMMCLSINRNILECKVFHRKKVVDRLIGVLIETYWNVKENDLVFLKNSFSVLIETYWNVKKVGDA